jgi:hypothetical protein
MDIQRIGVGKLNEPGINDPVTKPDTIPFEFSTTEITFDQTDRTFDEQNA